LTGSSPARELQHDPDLREDAIGQREARGLALEATAHLVAIPPVRHAEAAAVTAVVAPSEQQLVMYLPVVVLVAGLLMYMLCSGKVREVGRLILFAAVLAILIAIAPSTAQLLPR